MNKKYLILISAIVGLSIILIATILLKDKGYSVPTLKAVSADDIEEIRIISSTNEIIISKEDDKNWLLNDKYKADTNAIMSMAFAISSFEITDLLSRADDDVLSRYGLDSNNMIKIIAFNDKNKEIRNIDLGFNATIAYQNFAQINDDDNIYIVSATDNLRTTFDTKLEKLRNRKISSLLTVAIDEVNITKNDVEYSMSRQAPDPAINTNATPLPSYWTADWKNNAVIDGKLINSMLNSIGSVSAAGFLEDIDERGALIYTIILGNEDNDEKVQYSIFEANADRQYEVIVENDNSRYFISENSFNRINNTIDAVLN